MNASESRWKHLFSLMLVLPLALLLYVAVLALVPGISVPAMPYVYFLAAFLVSGAYYAFAHGLKGMIYQHEDMHINRSLFF
jgi:hypothetical protein